MISNKILIEEIKKTKETIETIKGLKSKSIKEGKKILEDCDVGIEINYFVLGKLEEQLKKQSK